MSEINEAVLAKITKVGDETKAFCVERLCEDGIFDPEQYFKVLVHMVSSGLIYGIMIHKLTEKDIKGILKRFTINVKDIIELNAAIIKEHHENS